jgi:O-antigen ligase/polysaccharide polymerase Wzy-like membrane protein
VLFHLALALVIYLVPITSKIFLLLVIGYFLMNILIKGNKNDEVLIAAAYITGFEVFSRMTHGLISYEFVKYMVIVFLTIGMFYKGFKIKSWPFLLYLLFLVPGILFSAINLDYDSSVANAIGFNLSGPVSLAIAALYCYDRKISAKRMQQILLAMLLPIISMTLYLYLYTPSIKDVLTGTASNFATSGGYGPNQVATVLGLAMFILFVRLFLIRDRFINSIDLALISLISYRGIVTFSRGGILTAVISILAFSMVYFYYAKGKQRISFSYKFVFVILLSLGVWVISSINTGGLIDKRYSNQDAAGRIKEDVTTGRVDLLDVELQAFYENPLTGIGVGKIKEYRYEQTGRLSATHNEMSRMLSEHGLFGLFALSVLFFTPLLFRLKNRTNLLLYSFFIFWFLTINHSSMRIAAPAFIYGLSLITIINVQRKRTLHRK